MRNLRLVALIVTCLVPLAGTSETKVLDIPIIIQEGTFQGKPVGQLCGTTCAEMILKYYGVTNISNVDIAETFCSRLYPSYNKRMKYSPSQKKKYSTDCETSLGEGGEFTGTNTHVLELYFKSLGFETDRTRTRYDRDTGGVPAERFDSLMKHVRAGRPVIIHVERHYMLVAGYDDTNKTLYVIDPSDREILTVSYDSFRNRNSLWRRTRPERKGWDGRYLAAWK
jgi:hypothetical protein